MNNRALVLVLSSVLALAGCATSFTGSAYYNGGAAGCFNACERIQMRQQQAEQQRRHRSGWR